MAAVNFGAALPRALVAKGAPVASVTDLEGYGLMTYKDAQDQRDEALGVFRDMYTQAIGSGPVMDFLSQTGLAALRGADILGAVPGKYSSTVEYASNSFAESMKGVAQVLQADVGTRICYTSHGSFDAHTNGIALQEGLLRDVSGGIHDFYSDMREHGESDDVLIFVLLRVRAAGEGQRQRHGPRLRRRGLPHRRRGEGRTLQRVSVAGRGQAGRGATWPSTWTSAACTRRSSKTGCASTPSRSFRESTTRSAS